MISARGISAAGLLSVLLATSAMSDSPKLGPDEGIVLMGPGFGMLRHIEFWRWGEKSGFLVSMTNSMRPLVVKSGNYYMRTITVAAANIFPIVQPQPSSMTGTFEIRAGSVTYIGDVQIVQDTSQRGQSGMLFDIAYRPEQLIEAKESYPWLVQFPLFVSRVGSAPLAVSWSTDRAAESTTDAH